MFNVSGPSTQPDVCRGAGPPGEAAFTPLTPNQSKTQGRPPSRDACSPRAARLFRVRLWGRALPPPRVAAHRPLPRPLPCPLPRARPAPLSSGMRLSVLGQMGHFFFERPSLVTSLWILVPVLEVLVRLLREAPACLQPARGFTRGSPRPPRMATRSHSSAGLPGGRLGAGHLGADPVKVKSCCPKWY